ncbi:MAG: hypothetical protein DSZ05_06800, partial [Sulfurospirillum sp.]
MIFLRPDYLLFMMIPLTVLFYFIVTGKSQVQTIFDKKMLEKLTVDNDALGRVGRNILLFAALFLMIVALARPAIPKGEVEAALLRIDLLVGLDISRSMLATDRYPNRLAFAKKKIYELLEKFEEARVGVIAFANDAFLVSPLTEDKQTLRFLIDNLNTDALSTGGTNLMVPIEKAAEFMKEDQEKILILFTDGGDKKDFSKEIEAAKKAGVTVYIYAVGTEKGSAIPFLGENIKDQNGNIVITKRNPAVKQLALETGGAYIAGGYKDQSVEMVIRDIKNKFRMHRLKSRKIRDYEELFYFPLTIAVLLMLMAFSSLPRYTSAALLLLPLLFMPAPSQAGILDFHEIKEGFHLYQQEQYRDAVRHFEKVAKSRRDAPSWYDLGNAYYKSGRYKDAVKAYLNAKTDDPALAYKIYFNLGNALFQAKAYAKALKAYQIAQKIKTEPDLEYNIELTKKHLKQKPPKKKPGGKKKKNRQNDNRQQNRNDKQKNQQNKSQPDNSDKKSKANQSKKPQKGGSNNQTQKAPISDKEVKKWEKRLQKTKPKTMPIRLRTKEIEREKNAKPW